MQAYKIKLKKKPTLLFLIMFTLFCTAGYGQQKITLKTKNESLKNVLDEIKKQSGVSYFYSPELFKNANPVTVDFKNITLQIALNDIFKNQPLNYSLKNGVLIITEKPQPSTPEENVQPKSFIVKGSVRDAVSDSSIDQPTVRIKGTAKGMIASKGLFSLSVEPSDTIVVTHIGFKEKEIVVSEKDASRLIIVSLEQDATVTSEEEVIVTGRFDLNKQTFTGATNTVSGEDLRKFNRENILEGLSLLDPSINITRSNSRGGDPNQQMKIQVRGGSTAPTKGLAYNEQLQLEYETDPNQPLFILDGFETNLKTIVNLDVNRVKSVTILKDAASTALYGPKSANGVIVIETIKPKAGQLNVTYSVTGALNFPNLNGYNMMSAAELLEFQILRGENGPFGKTVGGNIDLPLLEEKRVFRQNAVDNGINTNWLNYPLRNATTLNHSLNITGGDGNLTYSIGFTKNSNPGVVKQSSNNNLSAFSVLNYRRGKLNISNNFTVSGNKQQGSPYGTFKTYVNLPPYYSMFGPDGEENRSRYLEFDSATTLENGNLQKQYYRYPNPLKNALLKYKNQTETTTMTNNLNVMVDIVDGVRFTSGFQFSKVSGGSDFYKSPDHTDFDGIDPKLAGSYDWNTNASTNYSFNAAITYYKVLREKHIFNVNLRSDVQQTNTKAAGVSAVGFATTSEPLLYLARTYPPDGKPSGSDLISRNLGIVGNLVYSYDRRYNFNASWNRSGASNYGVSDLFKDFYGVGLSWNVGEEAFFNESDLVSNLQVFANAGLTGNQVENFASRTTYILDNYPSFLGEALNVSKIKNPNLVRSKTYDISYGLTGSFFKNILSLSLSGYRKLTSPMILGRPLPLSNGIKEGVPQNIGQLLNQGLELAINVTPVNNRDWTWVVGANSPIYTSGKYSGLGKALDNLNEEVKEELDKKNKGEKIDLVDNNFLQRYIDGASPYDAWAVRSVGVDAATGNEVFMDSSGLHTYNYSKDYEVIVGSLLPKLKGNINSSLRYKQLSLSFAFQFALKETKFNNALYDKVESIVHDQDKKIYEAENNQDRRALTDRWKQPGDNAHFIGITQNPEGMSDKYLVQENYLEMASINLSYSLSGVYAKKLKEKLGLNNLSFSLGTNRIFRFSNVLLERGLDYPEMRVINFNISTSF